MDIDNIKLERNDSREISMREFIREAINFEFNINKPINLDEFEFLYSLMNALNSSSLQIHIPDKYENRIKKILFQYSADRSSLLSKLSRKTIQENFSL